MELRVLELVLFDIVEEVAVRLDEILLKLLEGRSRNDFVQRTQRGLNIHSAPRSHEWKINADSKTKVSIRI